MQKKTCFEDEMVEDEQAKRLILNYESETDRFDNMLIRTGTRLPRNSVLVSSWWLAFSFTADVFSCRAVCVRSTSG